MICTHEDRRVYSHHARLRNPREDLWSSRHATPLIDAGELVTDSRKHMRYCDERSSILLTGGGTGGKVMEGALNEALDVGFWREVRMEWGSVYDGGEEAISSGGSSRGEEVTAYVPSW